MILFYKPKQRFLFSTAKIIKKEITRIIKLRYFSERIQFCNDFTLLTYQCYCTAYEHHQIYHFTHSSVTHPIKAHSAHRNTQYYPTEPYSPAHGSLSRIIPVPRPEKKIEQVEQQPESLHRCHILTLVVYDTHPIHDNRRPRHREHRAHHTAQRTCRGTRPPGAEQSPRFTFEEDKIECH